MVKEEEGEEARDERAGGTEARQYNVPNPRRLTMPVLQREKTWIQIQVMEKLKENDDQ